MDPASSAAPTDGPTGGVFAPLPLSLPSIPLAGRFFLWDPQSLTTPLRKTAAQRSLHGVCRIVREEGKGRREGGRTKAEAKLFLSPPSAAGAGLRAGTTEEEEEADVEELVVMMVMPVPPAWQAVRRVLLEGGGGEAVAGGGRIEEVELAGKRSTRTHARLM